MSYRLRNILIALALAIVAALLVTYYVANYKKHVQRQQATVPVFVAAKDIPIGTSGADVLKGHYLTRESLSRESLVPGWVSDPGQISKQVVTQPIYTGEQVTVRHFGYVVVTGLRSELSGVYRAFQLSGDANQLLTGTLHNGDHVDVVANIHFHVSDFDVKSLATANGTGTSGSDKDRIATRIVLRDVKVLRTSTSPGNGKLQVGGTAGGSWVMLELSDNQVQKLYWVKQNADWWLALRPVLKPSDSPNSVETVESVLADGLSLKPYNQLFFGKQGPNR